MSEDDSPPPHGAATSANVAFSGPEARSLQAYLRIGGAEAASAPLPSMDALGSASSYVPSSLRELGDEAVWSLSSAKQGNGVEQMRDDDIGTFWQSDGTLPHVVTVQFHRKTRVSCLAMYLDQKQDESYTPGKVCIRVGSGAAAGAAVASASMLDLGVGGASDAMEVREIERFELEEPCGWVIVHLKQPLEDVHGQAAGPDGEGAAIQDSVRCHFIQLVILSSFQNGRDTRVRQIKLVHS